MLDGRKEPEAAQSTQASEPEAEDEPAAEGSVNVWPDEAAEAAFLAEQSGAPQESVAVAKAAPAAVPDDNDDEKPLPTLDELVKQISPETRELLDDLFRARFTSVRRVPRKVLKT